MTTELGRGLLYYIKKIMKALTLFMNTKRTFTLAFVKQKRSRKQLASIGQIQ